MSIREKEVQSTYQFDFSWIAFIPLMILVGIIPLVVRYTKATIEDPVMRFLWQSSEMGDVFSQVKAQLVLITLGIIGIILFLTFNKAYIKKDKTLKIAYIGTLIYTVMTILATTLSPYKHTAMWGAPDRAEGGLVLIAYIGIMLYTLYVVNKHQDYKYIAIPMLIMTVIMMGIGITQYMGKDILVHNDFVKKLMVPEQYAEVRDSLTSIYTGGNIHGTLFHYNYVGTFSAMVIPFFAVLTLMVRKPVLKLAFAVGTLCGIGLLIGSTARSGLVGISVVVVVAILLFGRQLLQKWQWTVGVVVVIAIGSIGVNTISGGELFRRIPSLVGDALAMFTFGEDTVDFRTQLPIQNITHENQQMIVHTLQGDLYLAYDQERQIQFTDETGQKVDYQLSGETYTTQDPRFINLIFTKAETFGDIPNFWNMEVGTESFGFTATQEGVHLANPMTGEQEELHVAPSIGFKGKEKLGSARGYIWSRSLPLLKDNLLIGKGPDSFIAQFPQDDVLGKWYAYDSSNMTVDKPHNMYLQIALNQGVVALVGFLILIGTYLVQSFRLYGWRRKYEEKYLLGCAIMLGVVGYLGAGLFNDSVVSVAPIFWVLLGMGMAVNYLVNKEKVREKKNAPHGVIRMRGKRRG